MKTITNKEIKNYLDKGDKVVFVEAMSEKHFAEGHLPGAISIPPEKIETVAPKMLKDKNQVIITYCASEKCSNSKTAAQALGKLGYKNVVAYAGGKEDWKKAGFKLEGASCATDAGTGSCSTGGAKKSSGGCH